jgi:hypothetical protein
MERCYVGVRQIEGDWRKIIMGNLNEFLETLNEEAGEENKEKGEKAISAEKAGVVPSFWNKIPGSVKDLFYWYREALPSEEEEQHGFYEFLDDVVNYLMSFSMMSSLNRAGKLIADYDMKGSKKDAKDAEESETDEE